MKQIKKGLIRKELARKVSDDTGLNLNQCEDIILNITKHITKSLEAGKPVYIRGFGTFLVKDIKEQPAYNFKEGKSYRMKGFKKAFFKPSPTLQSLLNMTQ